MTDDTTTKPKTTKLRIVSDGNPGGTYVETEDGKRLEGVTAIDWSIRLGGFARCEVQLDHGSVGIDAVACDVTGEVE